MSWAHTQPTQLPPNHLLAGPTNFGHAFESGIYKRGRAQQVPRKKCAWPRGTKASKLPAQATARGGAELIHERPALHAPAYFAPIQQSCPTGMMACMDVHAMCARWADRGRHHSRDYEGRGGRLAVAAALPAYKGHTHTKPK